MVYDYFNQINGDIEKTIDVLTQNLMKIKYGNSYIFLENPKALIEILSKKIIYSQKENTYQLILSRFRDNGLIRYVNNYKIYIKNDNNEYNFNTYNLFLKDKKDSNEKYFKMFTKETIVGDSVCFDIHIFTIDILNIVRDFAIKNKWR